jgi:hypothetical protein
LLGGFHLNANDRIQVEKDAALAVVVGLIELDLEARSMGQRDSAII